MAIHVQRIATVDDAFINQLNLLFDEGSEWDVVQGSKFLSDPNNALFVGFWESTPAGFATAYRLQRYDRRQAEVYLDEIGVDEAYQQRGIGKALMRAVQRWSVEVDASGVWLVTNKSNTAAVALYTSMDGEEDASDVTLYAFMNRPR
jgi:ribosomal protein S18 acetylase RimI-like enzyme